MADDKDKKDETPKGLDKIEAAAQTPTEQPPSEGLTSPPRGPGRPRKNVGAEAPPSPSPQQPQVIVVQAPVPAIPDAIPDFDKTEPGGRYYDNRGRLVDARGELIKKMGVGRDEDDVAAQAERDEQIDLYAQDHERS